MYSKHYRAEEASEPWAFYGADPPIHSATNRKPSPEPNTKKPEKPQGQAEIPPATQPPCGSELARESASPTTLNAEDCTTNPLTHWGQTMPASPPQPPVEAGLLAKNARHPHVPLNTPATATKPALTASRLTFETKNYPDASPTTPSALAPVRLDASSLSRSRVSTFTASSTNALLIEVR
jgi:hypothetical protein